MVVIQPSDKAALVYFLQTGKVGVLPTDTVYGIVARAEDTAAVAALYRAKHREGKPGTIIAANAAQLVALGIAREYLDRVARLWPDALSVIVPSPPALAYLDQGQQSLAVRVPKNPAIHELLLQTGPLLTSSANQPGQLPARNRAEAEAYFGESVDFYVDGVVDADAQPSTIVRVTESGELTVVRAGAVTIKE